MHVDSRGQISNITSYFQDGSHDVNWQMAVGRCCISCLLAWLPGVTG